MIDIHVGIAILCLFAIVLLVLFILCHSSDALTYLCMWIYSSKEEKLGLTRSKGHYNANGYLVHSDSDIQLGTSGSFKRFDAVDKDFRMTVACTSFSESDHATPLQPQRPPAALYAQPNRPLFTDNTRQVCHERVSNDAVTSISPIPRPVSSINMSELAANSQYPNISPPPTMTSGNSKTYPLLPTSSVEHQVESDDVEVISGALKRAMSCESVCSDTSVALGDLEEADVSGYLCIGFEYESETSDLIVNVLEARSLRMPMNEDNQMDSYVRVILLPDKETHIQTKVYRSASSPSYKERFLFPLNPREQSQKSICFHVYCIDGLSHVLIGEGEIRLSDVSLRQPVTTWVSLTDTGQKIAEYGELMFSLSYLPTAERLTVVVVKARKLRFENETGDSFVKVYLLHHGKKIHKKKTSTKKSEKWPIFNEAIMFSVPAHSLQTIQLRLTVAEVPKLDNAPSYCIGHVIIGAQASGRSLNHWNQMLTALRKPVAMWHPLRK